MFADIIEHAELDSSKTTLEIGPGTGQATEPILQTGTSYLAIELGEHLSEYTKSRFRSYDNFQIINGDFEEHDFGLRKFDLVYSAATIQWIPEDIGFSKVSNILNSGGSFAMMMTLTDEKSQNEGLYRRIQEVYDECFRPEDAYTCKLAYDNVVNYGFTDFECRKYHQRRELNADEYVSYIGTHCTHITLQEPYRSQFFSSISDAISDAGGNIILDDTIVLYLARRS